MSNRLSKALSWEWSYLAALCLYFGILFSSYSHEVFDPYAYEDSMAGWIPPALAAPAPASEQDRSYFSRRGLHRNALGWWGLMRIGRIFMDPVVFSKVFPWFVLLVTIIYLYILGRRLGGPPAGFLACIFLLHMPYLPGSLVGIPNVFAFPLLIAFLYHLHQGHHRRLLVLMVLQALFYAPILVSTVGIYMVHQIQRRGDPGRLTFLWRDARLLRMGITLAVLVPILFPWGMLAKEGKDRLEFASYETLAERDIVRQCHKQLSGEGDPDCGTHAECYGILRQYPFILWTEHFLMALGQPIVVSGNPPALVDEYPPAWETRFAPAIALTLLLLVAILVGPRIAAQSRLLQKVLLSSSLLYLAALLAAFYLFFPQRYVQYTLTLTSVLLVAMLVAGAFRGLRPVVRGAAPLAFSVIYLFFLGSGIRAGSDLYQRAEVPPAVLQYLAKVDPSSVIAGPTILMNDVALFSNRRAFLICEEELNENLLDGKLHDIIKNRVGILNKMYFSRTGTELLASMSRNRIDYMLVRGADFHLPATEEGGPEICDGRSRTQVHRYLQEGGPFFLAAPPAGVVVKAEGRFSVVSRDALAAYLATHQG